MKYGCVHKVVYAHKPGATSEQALAWPEALKCEIVAATLVPGASVSVLARQHDVNANQVISWRRRYGEASKSLSAPPSTYGMVPVTITPEPETEGRTSPTPTTSEKIEIEVSGDCRVRVGSSFDDRTLKRVRNVLSPVPLNENLIQTTDFTCHGGVMQCTLQYKA